MGISQHLQNLWVFFQLAEILFPLGSSPCQNKLRKLKPRFEVFVLISMCTKHGPAWACRAHGKSQCPASLKLGFSDKVLYGKWGKLMLGPLSLIVMTVTIAIMISSWRINEEEGGTFGWVRQAVELGTTPTLQFWLCSPAPLSERNLDTAIAITSQNRGYS